MVELGFGAAGSVDASVSDLAKGLVGSEILKIAAEIRVMTRAGNPASRWCLGVRRSPACAREPL